MMTSPKLHWSENPTEVEGEDDRQTRGERLFYTWNEIKTPMNSSNWKQFVEAPNLS